MHRRSDATESPDQGTKAPLEVPGRVVEALPNALFRVEIEGERRQMVTAHVSGASSLLRLLPGETVVVELMAYDTTRGRIVRRKS